MYTSSYGDVVDGLKPQNTCMLIECIDVQEDKDICLILENYSTRRTKNFDVLHNVWDMQWFQGLKFWDENEDLSRRLVWINLARLLTLWRNYKTVMEIAKEFRNVLKVGSSDFDSFVLLSATTLAWQGMEDGRSFPVHSSKEASMVMKEVDSSEDDYVSEAKEFNNSFPRVNSSG
ncbi:hypothetical protein Tco_1184097 [Tanacetum coccineum]